MAELRRNTVEAALALSVSPQPSHISPQPSAIIPQTSYHLPYLYNASNALARAFYEQQGIQVADAFEVRQPAERLIMQKEPLSLRLGDGRQFRLEFDCRHCQMNIYADE